MMPEGEGARMWVASNEGTDAAPCAFCARPTKAAPEGVCFCHRCQEVWVPPGFVVPNPPPAVSGLLPAPAATRCGNCGAPIEPDEMGRCRYCRAQVAAPQPIVVEIDSGARSGSGDRLLDGLVGLLTDPLR
ncbi:MAG: hypothetical protein JO337_11880 [Acidimicrobiales bacterium]|nr:hypothetical protein [Acidimicrobiales bacterium]